MQFAIDMSQNYGFKIVEEPQGARHMNEPTKAPAPVQSEETKSRRQSVLKWMADNMVVTTDVNHNVRLNKEKSKQKIDGIVALIIALSRVIAAAGRLAVMNSRAIPCRKYHSELMTTASRCTTAREHTDTLPQSLA
jgi:phage terminase large subunit-like protein